MTTLTGTLCIFKIEFGACAKTYPSCGAPSPCSNAYGMVGTYNTCSNKCLYECSVQSEIFSNCAIPHHISQDLGSYKHSPSVVGKPRHTPTKICFGDTFSRPSTFTFSISGIKYCNDPFNSTPLDRLIDAQKYWEGRRVVAYFGDCSQSLCEFDKHVFIIDKIQGPTGEDCRYQITARSPLAAIDGVKCPDGLPKISESGDEVELTLGVNLDGEPTEDEPDADPYATVNQYLLSQDLLDDSGKQTDCILQAKFLCVDGELVSVMPELTGSGGYNFLHKDRAQCGSTLKAHDIGAKITIPLVFQPHEHVADVVRRILIECADMTEVFLLCCDDDQQVYLNEESLEAFRCKNPLMTLNDYAVFCKPTDAGKLLKSLAETFLFGLYEEAGQIKMLSLCPSGDPAQILTQAQVIESSESTKNSGDRATGVIYRHTVDDWTKDGKDDNLLNTTGVIREDFLLEPCARNEYAQTKIKEIQTPFINQTNGFQAYTGAMRWRKVLACPADEMCVTLTMQESKRFVIGTKSKLLIEKNRDYTGEYKQQEWIVVSRQILDKGDCVQVCFRESPFADEKPCLSCDFQFPAVYDPCGIDCVSVW